MSRNFARSAEGNPYEEEISTEWGLFKRTKRKGNGRPERTRQRRGNPEQRHGGDPRGDRERAPHVRRGLAGENKALREANGALHKENLGLHARNEGLDIKNDELHVANDGLFGQNQELHVWLHHRRSKEAHRRCLGVQQKRRLHRPGEIEIRRHAGVFGRPTEQHRLLHTNSQHPPRGSDDHYEVLRVP